MLVAKKAKLEQELKIVRLKLQLVAKKILKEEKQTEKAKEQQEQQEQQWR